MEGPGALPAWLESQERDSLALAEGTIFRGCSFGHLGNASGEVACNTDMAGYPGSLTDPSYEGQIRVITYPSVGNCGVLPDECDSWGMQKK